MTPRHEPASMEASTQPVATSACPARLLHAQSFHRGAVARSRSGDAHSDAAFCAVTAACPVQRGKAASRVAGLDAPLPDRRRSPSRRTIDRR